VHKIDRLPTDRRVTFTEVIFPSVYLLVTIASMLVDVLNQKFNKQAKLGVEPLHC